MVKSPVLDVLKEGDKVGIVVYGSDADVKVLT